MQQENFQTPIKVRYRAHPLLPKILWPILDVKLSYKKITLPRPFDALVDSGANKSLVHIRLVQHLGFDIKKLGQPEQGASVSGVYNAWILSDPVRVNIYGYEYAIKFTVIDNPQLIWPCILGEDSIFQFARLDFQKFKGFFEIRFRTDIH